MTIRYIVKTAGLEHVRKTTGTIENDDGERIVFRPHGARHTVTILSRNLLDVEAA